ncbi:universal stress protein [Natronolimnobius sp. AArcel1]|uniref:universal stress protein n=1 Tax=Natronolimnobius sp. AArcel1 TaxID=1679093 RepID=UPI0013EA0964|nr:universal stress protein [Natronolimnobius sp. AArcel1]NGM69609.1 universal stress protein [Natronolimnobius sp. AArcel1]
MYQDVLIPTDGSDGTRRSIEHGLAIAEQFDATVHALSIVPEGPLGTLEAEEATPAAYRAVERVQLEAEAAGVDVVTAVEHGVPHEEILAYIDAHDIEMVVMGTQGRTGIDRVLMGSVTERVVRMSDTPVVTVRLTEDLRIEDADEAERLARDALAAEDHDREAPLSEQPHRTSASWIVPFDLGDERVHVHVDAVSRETRVARPPR